MASWCSSIDSVEPLLPLDGLRRLGELPENAVFTRLQLPPPRLEEKPRPRSESPGETVQPEARGASTLHIVIGHPSTGSPVCSLEVEVKTGAGSARALHSSPGTPRRLRRAASRGALPMLPRELVATQLALLWDPDPEISGAAERAVTELQPQIARAVLSDPAVGPAALGELLRRHAGHDAFVEPLLVNRATPIEAVAMVASTCSEPMAEIIAHDHQRLLERPDLALSLAANPAVPRSTIHRVVDFLVRSGLFLEAREFHASWRRIAGDEEPPPQPRPRRSAG